MKYEISCQQVGRMHEGSNENIDILMSMVESSTAKREEAVRS